MAKSKKRSSAAKLPATTVKIGRINPAKSAVTNEDRQHMISEAAYYLAEQRGFSAGGELGDWLEAERQISVSLTQKGN